LSVDDIKEYNLTAGGEFRYKSGTCFSSEWPPFRINYERLEESGAGLYVLWVVSNIKFVNERGHKAVS
jgi:hypothetical protein